MPGNYIKDPRFITYFILGSKFLFLSINILNLKLLMKLSSWSSPLFIFSILDGNIAKKEEDETIDKTLYFTQVTIFDFQTITFYFKQCFLFLNEDSIATKLIYKQNKVAFEYMDLDFKSIDLKYLDSKSIDFKISCFDQFIQRRI